MSEIVQRAKPLYIFDLDGTLADCQHRVPILAEKDDPNRWRRFYAACVDDTPIMPVIGVLHALVRSGADVWVFSGRSEEVRDVTHKWLYAATGYFWLRGINVTMRAEGDHRADDIVKGEWVDGMLDVDRDRLVAAFDDRDRVVAMWRSRGIQCFQVAPGDF